MGGNGDCISKANATAFANAPTRHAMGGAANTPRHGRGRQHATPWEGPGMGGQGGGEPPPPPLTSSSLPLASPEQPARGGGGGRAAAAAAAVAGL